MAGPVVSEDRTSRLAQGNRGTSWGTDAFCGGQRRDGGKRLGGGHCTLHAGEREGSKTEDKEADLLSDEDTQGRLGSYKQVDNQDKWHFLFIKPLHKMLSKNSHLSLGQSQACWKREPPRAIFDYVNYLEKCPVSNQPASHSQEHDSCDISSLNSRTWTGRHRQGRGPRSAGRLRAPVRGR